MIPRWQWIAAAALLLGVPLAAGSARGQEHVPTPATAARKKPAKPPAKPAKPPTKAKAPSMPYPGPGAIGSHRPPVPPPTPGHSHYDVPQPKSLAETPDVVLNSKVRASLMSALTAAKEEDITSQTVKGVVTLTGSVKTKELRARAEQVARHVHGVRAVRNRLTLK